MKDSGSDLDNTKRHPVIFAVFAETEEQLYHTLVLVESIRAFAGSMKDAPVWVFLPGQLKGQDPGTEEAMRSLGVEIKCSEAPEAALTFYFARKVFAAAEAEVEASGKADILVWMDEDTIVLKEPQDFLLGEGIRLGYRPVMHKNIGSLYSESADEFWTRLYSKLSVSQESIFPMVTTASRETLRPYFNAGILVVRPKIGILRQWAECFPKLYQDQVFVQMSSEDNLKRIFLHQAALTGAILKLLKPEGMVELSERINYPLFFKRMFGAEREFDSLDDVVTLRYDVYFRNPDANWSQELKGSPAIISWLEERLGKKASATRPSTMGMSCPPRAFHENP